MRTVRGNHASHEPKDPGKSRKRTAVGLEVMEVRSQSGADESRQLKQM